MVLCNVAIEVLQVIKNPRRVLKIIFSRLGETSLIICSTVRAGQFFMMRLTSKSCLFPVWDQVILFRLTGWYSNSFCSCLSSYNFMLNMTSTPFAFVLFAFYLNLNYFDLNQDRCIIFLYLLHISNSSNININIPGQSLVHLSGVLVSLNKLQMIA